MKIIKDEFTFEKLQKITKNYKKFNLYNTYIDM